MKFILFYVKLEIFIKLKITYIWYEKASKVSKNEIVKTYKKLIVLFYFY